MTRKTSRYLVLVEAYLLTEEEKEKSQNEIQPAWYPEDLVDGYDVRLTPIGLGTDYPTPIDYDIENAGLDYVLEENWEHLKEMLPDVEPGQWARVLTVWEHVFEKWGTEYGGYPYEYETYEYVIGKVDYDEVLKLVEDEDV